MTARYHRVGDVGGDDGAGLVSAHPESRRPRRPRRFLPFALGLFFLIACATWLSFNDHSASSSTAERKTQVTGEYSAKDRPSAFGGHKPSSYRTDAGEISPAAVLYDKEPVQQPIPYEELSRWAQKGDDGKYYPPPFIPASENKAVRAKAGFIVLVRNSELEGLKKSMRDVEFRFNRKYNYPWIFLNDNDFTDEFKAGVRTMTRSEIRFGRIPSEHWGYPVWIDQAKAAANRAKMAALGTIPYADSESYRHMCRFQSGFFFRHPLTLDLDYYWRVEPGIELSCDVDYDPFLFMQMNNKTYAFTITIADLPATIPTLWDTAKAFFAQHPQYLAQDNARDFIIEDRNISLADSEYNLCHFWDNMEVVDLRFFRSKPYLEFFEHLDKSGGYFYERWGDAPVHSIAAALMLNRSQIHNFDDFGYFHAPAMHCPENRAKYHDNGKCSCDPKASWDHGSCMHQWWAVSKEGPPKL